MKSPAVSERCSIDQGSDPIKSTTSGRTRSVFAVSAEELATSAGFERISKVLDFRGLSVRRPNNRHHVKSSRLIQATVSFKPFQSDLCQFVLLSEIHGFEGLA